MVEKTHMKNMVLGQLKMGEHQEKCRALPSTHMTPKQPLRYSSELAENHISL